MASGQADRRPAVAVRVACGATILTAVGFLAAWAARVLPRHGSLDHFNAVRSYETLKTYEATPFVPVVAVLMVAAALARRPSLLAGRAAAIVVALTLAGVAGPFLSVVGHQVVIVSCAAILAVVAGATAPSRWPVVPRSVVRWTPWALWLLVAVIHAIYSMHRHAWFGSGSWDHGCMIHNFYRASRLMDSTSTVLGDVDFLGDHFMVGIYLYAPLIWLNASGYMILAIQAVNLAAAAPAVYLMARHRGLGYGPATVLALAVALSFGLQSGAYFDSHEITVGFGFLAWGLWAFETGRLRAATLLLFVFALFKESLGAYVVGLGLLALWRGAVGRDRRHVKYGALWVLGGVIWFVLVNRVFMPALIARANLPEPHETFADFGPTVFEAAVGIATHPLKALAAIFVPDEKLLSLGVTFGGTGWLALASPQVGLAALPLFAERFLSSKQTMWQMGYHYAAPLALYSGWAAIRGWAVVQRWLARGLRSLWRGGRGAAPVVLSAYVGLCALGMNGFGYRHPSNYFQWMQGYFSTPERQRNNAGAVDFLEARGRDARLAVQNRILPHLADRPVIYRLGDWQKADWVLLSIGESAWPWDDGYPKRLAQQLWKTPGWRLVYARGGTAVFTRIADPGVPEVAPTEGLGLASRRPRTNDSQNPP